MTEKRKPIMSKDPIRVLCVFGSLDRGGAETMCMELYRHIDRSKIQFDFVKHTDANCAYEEEIRSLGGKIFTAPRFRGINCKRYQSWWENHLGGHPEHQIIHGHYFTIAKYYFPVCRRMNRITICHCHTDTFKDPIRRIMVRGVENACDYRIACSVKAGKFLYPNKDYSVLKNAIDISKYAYNAQNAEAIRQEFSLGDDFVLGAIGTIKKVKNPLGIVEILRTVRDYIPEAKLLWAGMDGGMKEQVQRRISKLGLEDHVIFAGVRSDIPQILQAIDVYIMPSFIEGVPVALIEAQAAGVPSFVSDNVSREAAVTDICHFLPLDQWDKWASIINGVGRVRTDTKKSLMKAGYDINTTAEWLENYYLNMA